MRYFTLFFSYEASETGFVFYTHSTSQFGQAHVVNANCTRQYRSIRCKEGLRAYLQR